MVRKRKSLAELTCEGKVTWPSRKRAAKALKTQNGFLDWKGRDRSVLEVYQCSFCKQFHVGTTDVVRLRIERRANDRELDRKRAKSALRNRTGDPDEQDEREGVR